MEYFRPKVTNVRIFMCFKWELTKAEKNQSKNLKRRIRSKLYSKLSKLNSNLCTTLSFESNGLDLKRTFITKFTIKLK
jgi:hypothetical protein